MYDMIRFRFLTLAAVVCALTSAISCASKDTRLGSEPDESSYEGSKAAAGAWAVNHFTFRKTQKIRPANDYLFYFKHCEMNDERSFYSKTSYMCTEP